jgi:hypothetical protein
VDISPRSGLPWCGKLPAEAEIGCDTLILGTSNQR